MNRNLFSWKTGGQERHNTEVAKDLQFSWFQTFAMFWLLYAFFWVIPRHLNFCCFLPMEVKYSWFQTFALVWMLFAFFWVISPPQPVLYSDPHLTCHPPSYWLRLFSSWTFSHINTPTFLKLSHSSHLPAYEDGTNRVFRNVGI